MKKWANAAIFGREGLWDLLIENGSFLKIVEAGTGEFDSCETIDLSGKLVCAPFIEPHIHLDTTLTAGQPRWNESGTLFEGIQCWSERKDSLIKEDVKERAKKALSWQIANGIGAVRTHVDTTDPSLIALEAMLEVKSEMKDFVDLQIVAFPQEGLISYPNGLELVEEALKMGADIVGGIPHFEFTREDGVQSVREIFKLAMKYDKPIDIHCDEIDDEQSRHVEVVARETIMNEYQGRVTASHTTAMGSYNDTYTYKLMRVLGLAELNFVANPLVNIHLQGRFDTYPKRRGLTRVKELDQNGLNVCFGHDDIMDPWYPIGNGNMLQVLHMGLHASQLMGYSDIANSLRFVTGNSAKALNLKNYGIAEGNPANFVVLNAEDGYHALRLQAEVLYSVRNGKVIAETKPRETNVFLQGQKNITFM
ncbi:cytosine deaminase [Bacillus sp. FJAT-27986]|uniref:cytosine deaminase n=1 Tax=Bacillus sp. FJAT-27986 TaxID=1743146 RepID=UPI00080ACF95|nr:cytosine deaminase [Bacillus sp. FJAT-27986]OCA88669.1 cytosine deaminase [Bacillus sp. FJAT-27986]